MSFLVSSQVYLESEDTVAFVERRYAQAHAPICAHQGRAHQGALLLSTTPQIT